MTTPKTIKMFVSRYALTKGVTEERGHKSSDGTYFYVGGDLWSGMKIGRDAFHLRDEALKAAEKARKKKLDSLRKQVNKLKALKF